MKINKINEMKKDKNPEKNDSYDSTNDTLVHIKRVNELLIFASIELLKRATVHDNSKLESPEKELFDKYTNILSGITYGTKEYKDSLKKLQPALDHHYKNNSHHPEFYKNFMNGFDLYDLIEMFFDWKASSERHKDGDIFESIKINQKRFDYPDMIKNIFINTAKRMKEN